MNNYFFNPIEGEEFQETLPVGDFLREMHRSSLYYKESYVQHSVNKEAGMACALLMKEHSAITRVQLARAINKITEFVDCMDGLFSLDDDSLSLDTLDEECVSVKFKKAKDMSLDIYFDDEEDLVNEAYLSFMVKGKLRIMNDSIPNIAVVIKDLLF